MPSRSRASSAGRRGAGRTREGPEVTSGSITPLEPTLEHPSAYPSMAAREPRSVRRSAVLRLAMVTDALGLGAAGVVAAAASGLDPTDAAVLVALLLLRSARAPSGRAAPTRAPSVNRSSASCGPSWS